VAEGVIGEERDAVDHRGFLRDDLALIQVSTPVVEVGPVPAGR
jgi:hypothetical protein